MGIPLVTRVGQQFAARNSYAFMMQVGIKLRDLVGIILHGSIRPAFWLLGLRFCVVNTTILNVRMRIVLASGSLASPRLGQSNALPSMPYFVFMLCYLKFWMG